MLKRAEKGEGKVDEGGEGESEHVWGSRNKEGGEEGGMTKRKG